MQLRDSASCVGSAEPVPSSSGTAGSSRWTRGQRSWRGLTLATADLALPVSPPHRPGNREHRRRRRCHRASPPRIALGGGRTSPLSYLDTVPLRNLFDYVPPEERS